MFNNISIIKSININVILATHSPFILSDIPDSNILFLENGDLPQKSIKGTFCGNVCELLEQSFFLQSGFMGYYAKSIIYFSILKLMKILIIASYIHGTKIILRF